MLKYFTRLCRVNNDIIIFNKMSTKRRSSSHKSEGSKLSGGSSPRLSSGQDSSKTKQETMGRDKLGQACTGDGESPATLRGLDRLKGEKLNKGLAFSLAERQVLGIHGLLPAQVRTQDEQLEICKLSIDRYENNLNKYIYLMGLQNRNERLFYRLLTENVETMMPLVYTPTVGEACQKFSLIYRRARGLFINIHDKGHVYEVIRNWPETDVRAIVVTDGERILGLGDLGANGMGIPIGKMALYTALSGIKPHQCLPITLDVGTNTQSILNDPLYIGNRHKRVTGQEYDDFVDEFMEAVVRRYGPNCLIQFEDFGNSNAFRFLDKYRDQYCTFNDDIQGTASVALAGLYSSLRITNTSLKDQTFLFQGAGEAALGIANLFVLAMQKENISEQEARDKIWMVDSKGLIVKDRPTGGVSGHKVHFQKNVAPIELLVDVVAAAKPTVLIGASAIRGSFTPEILKKMGELNERPIIFALSNPTDKAECTAEEAYTHTNGNAVFSSGSPFPPFTINGKTLHTGQGNNSWVFPGIALGIICAGIPTVSEEIFILAAQTLTKIVSEDDLQKGILYPPLEKIRQCSVTIATEIVKYAYKNGCATVQPEPCNKETFVKAQLYDVTYQPSVPSVYSWPKL